MSLTNCAMCQAEIDHAARGGNAKTCSEQCSKSWKQAAQRYRRYRYRGTCCDCGVSTDGSGGYSKQSVRCRACHVAYASSHALWTRQAIIESIQSWHKKHGRAPTAMEWRTNNRTNDHPVTSRVQQRFGKWSDAIREAGFEPNPPGRRKK